MSVILQWVTRAVSSLCIDGRELHEDDEADYEQVDGARLQVDDFRSSASMRLDESPSIDFIETVPACSFVAPLASVAHERRIPLAVL